MKSQEEEAKDMLYLTIGGLSAPMITLLSGLRKSDSKLMNLIALSGELAIGAANLWILTQIIGNYLKQDEE